METKKFNSAEELMEAAKAAGVSEKRLDKAIDSHRLPAVGQFKEEITIVDGEMPHIRMECTDGSICSISRIRPSAAFVASKDDLETVAGTQEKTKDFAFLKTSILNSNLPANQATCAHRLAGKYFRTSLQRGYISPLKVDANKQPVFHKNNAAGIKTLKDSAVIKDFWVVEVSDTAFTE